MEAYGNAPAVLTAILAGRELGLAAMASLRGIHMVKGRAALSAQVMTAMILRSGLAEYFDVAELSATSCTMVTKRKSGRGEVVITHTIEMAERAGLVKPDSNWLKVPEDMLVARASSRLARLVYPDLMFGMYTPDELREGGQ